MALKIVNSDLWNRTAIKPWLGAGPEPMVVAANMMAVTPDSVPPEKVPPMPVSDEEATAARKTYMQVAGRLEDNVNQLNKIQPATWDETSRNLALYSKDQYDSLVRQVRGRTGNPDAEYELELSWWGLWDRAKWAYDHQPSAGAKAYDELMLFWSDFKKGAQEAWQGYSEWAITHAGPGLKEYHDCLKHVAELRADLDQAMASGNYSSGALFDQEQAVARAETAVQSVRSVYKALSAGGDIDKIATDTFGSYTMAQIQITAVLAIKVVVVLAVIALAAITVFSIGKIASSAAAAAAAVAEAVKKMAEDNPLGLLLTVGAIGAMIVLPLVLTRSPTETKVVVTPTSAPIPEKPEPEAA